MDEKHDAAVTTKRPRRRWYQFTLRTLLIGVVAQAIFCACVAREIRIVAARKAWLASHPQEGIQYNIVVVSIGSADGSEGDVPVEESLPLIRRWLGDELQYDLEIESEHDRTSAQALFPEARVHPLGRALSPDH